MVSNIFIFFIFTPKKLGKIPILTNILQMVWNHQPVLQIYFPILPPTFRFLGFRLIVGRFCHHYGHPDVKLSNGQRKQKTRVEKGSWCVRFGWWRFGRDFYVSKSPKGDILSLNDEAKNLWASWGELSEECSEANRDPTVSGISAEL